MVAEIQISPFDEITDFLTSAPSLEAIANFHLSDEADARISELLDANRENTLTPEEKAELDRYAHFEHVLRMIKIRAYEKLDAQAKAE